MTSRALLTQSLDTLLCPQVFKDYAPNGLQVEGRQEIQTLVSGVTASQALIERAVELRADAILVHHGLFWRGYDGRVTGWLKKRLALLLAQEINLYAYHLPLDAHEALGNNAQLAHRLGLTPQGRFGEQSLGWLGSVPDISISRFVHQVQQVMGRPVTQVLPMDWSHEKLLRRVAWCTGGAQSFFESAIASGAEVFLTGEISEPQAHYARECGVAYLACGHHATERYGVQAVGHHVAAQLGLAHTFVDIDNPA